MTGWPAARIAARAAMAQSAGARRGASVAALPGPKTSARAGLAGRNASRIAAVSAFCRSAGWP
ncbi:hypothetical protein MEME101129_12280 [Methylobacterium mesophilicum]